MATKSLITRVKIDRAGKSHNCQANRRHRIEKGEVRLKVRNGRSWDHYCQDCALKIIGNDLIKLQELQNLTPTIEA